MTTENIWQEGEEFLKTADSRFLPLMEKYGACTIKPVEPAKYFALLARGMLSTGIPPESAEELFQRLREKYGIMLPEQILLATGKDLCALGVPQEKIGYLKDLSRRAINKELAFGNFAGMSDAVKGLGRWTAELFLILGMGRPDVFPADDYGLYSALKDFCAVEKLPRQRTGKSILAEPWRPWRSLAVWYLWQHYAEKKMSKMEKAK